MLNLKDDLRVRQSILMLPLFLLTKYIHDDAFEFQNLELEQVSTKCFNLKLLQKGAWPRLP